MLILSFSAMHFVCDGYIESTIGGCCPSIPGRDSPVAYFSPTEFFCWDGSDPLGIAVLLATGGLLVCAAVSSSRNIESAFISTFLTTLRIFGRLTALFSIGLLTLVLYAYTHFEFFI